MLAPAAKPIEVRRCACTAPEKAASAAKTKVLLTMMRFMTNVLLVSSRVCFHGLTASNVGLERQQVCHADGLGLKTSDHKSCRRTGKIAVLLSSYRRNIACLRCICRG